MKLIVGLGNYGPKYENTRHNAGYMAIDYLADWYKIGTWSYESKFQSDIILGNHYGEKIIFCKPKTYMNLSGNAVTAIQNFYKIENNDLLVLHDDIDLDLGVLKPKNAGGHAGHNGIRDITAKIGTDKFLRIRIGVGRPSTTDRSEISNYVLGNFTSNEKKILSDKMPNVGDFFESFVGES